MSFERGFTHSCLRLFRFDIPSQKPSFLRAIPMIRFSTHAGHRRRRISGAGGGGDDRCYLPIAPMFQFDLSSEKTENMGFKKGDTMKSVWARPR